MIQIKLKLFGALRKFGTGSVIEVQTVSGTSIGDFRNTVAMKLRELSPGVNDAGLVFDSAFANETAILSDDYILIKNTEIAVLPPVCGG